MANNDIINLGLGSAATPSLSFNGDPNTGLFSAAPDSLSLTTAGNEALTIDSSGRVGVGTTTPASLLQVAGGVQIANDPDACIAGKAGTLKYSGGVVSYCDGASWEAFGTASGGEVNTASNVTGSTGVGIYKQKTGSNIELKSLLPANTKVTISGGVDDVMIGVSEANFDSALIPNTPAGGIAAANVQAAINELDSEKLSTVTGSALTNGNIWVGDGSNQAASVAMSGDATLSNTGALTISAGAVDNGKLAADAVDSSNIVNDSIMNADINSAAAIARTKLANGTANRILINDGSGVMVDASAITANRALLSDANGIPVASSVTNTELGYLSGVTSSIQTQLNSKEGSLGYTPVNRAGDDMFGQLTIDGGTDEVQLAIEADILQTANLVEIRDSSTVVLASISSDGSITAPTNLTTKSYVDTEIASAVGSLSSDEIRDADNNTKIQVEEGANDDTIRFDTAGTERMVIASTGNIGVGTTVPRRRISVYRSDDTTSAISIETTGTTGNQTAQVDLVSNADGNILGAAATNRGWQLFTRGNTFSVAGERNDLGFSYWNGATWNNAFRIDSLTGYIGVGTSSPSTRMDIAGTMKLADGGEACAIAGDGGMVRYNAGNLQFCNGSSWQTLGVSGAGLTSLGGQTGSTQTFAAGTAGNSPAINSAGNTHTLNVPLASAGGTVTSGTISNADYVSFSNKLDAIVGESLTSGNMWLGNGSNQAASVAMSGDATLANDGTLSIAANAIGSTEIANNAVTSAKINDGEIVDADINASAGIAATKLATGSIDNTEFGYLDGVTSNIQTQLDGKQASLAYTPVNKAGDSMTAALTMNTQSEVRFADGDSSNYVSFRASASVGANVIWTLPSADGTTGQILSTDGTGILSWINPASGSDNLGNHTATTDLNLDNNDIINLGLGTAAAPSLSFNADPNTGLFSAAPDSLSLSTAGSEALTINSSGNVGIGTPTPDADLSIQAGANAWSEGISLYPNGTGDSGLFFRTTPNATTTTWGLVRNSSNNLGFRREGLSGMSGTGAGIEALRLKSDGTVNFGSDVGIGIANPAGILHIAGNNEDVYHDSNNSTVGSSGADYVFRRNRAGGIVQADDKIGGIKADAHDGTGYSSNANDHAFIFFEVDGTPGASDMPTRISFGTNADGVDTATERMRITASGNVGIGTTTPATKIDIAGTMKIANGGEACSIAGDGGMIRYNGGNLQFCNGSSWQTLGVSGAGLTSLGGQTGSTQTFASGSAGNAPAIASSANVHTLNVPLASAGGTVTSGTISNADYVSFSNKLDAVAGETLADGNIWVGNGSNQAAAVAMSGDATLANDGTLSLSANAVGTTEIANNAVTSAKINDGEIVDADINASAAITATKIAGGSVDNTEFGYLNGVTSSSIQTQLDGKQASLGFTPVNKAGDNMTGDLTLDATNEIRFADADSSNYVGFASPALVTTDLIWTLPATDGTSGQVLSTNGSGILSWTAIGAPAADSLDFTHFADAMTLDATTDISVTGSNVFSVTNSGTGNSFVVNDQAADTTPFVIDASGNVGIGGINAPGAQLTLNASSGQVTRLAFLNGDVNHGMTIPATTDTFLRIDKIDAAAGGANFFGLSDTALTSGIRLQGIVGSSAALGSTPAVTIEGFKKNGTNTQSLASNEIILSVRNGSFSPSLVILGNDNVGIGTTTPGEKLDVEGSILSGPKGTAAGEGGAIKFEELAANGTNTVGFRAPNAIAANVLWELPAVDGSSGQVLSTNGSGVLSWASLGGGGDFMANGSVAMTGNMIIGNNYINNDGGATEGLSIDAAGRGSFTANTTATNSLRINNTNSTLNSKSSILFSHNGGTHDAEIESIYNPASSGSTELAFITRDSGSENERVRISSDGRIGIGTTTPSQKLDVAGNARIRQELQLADSDNTNHVGFAAPAIVGADLIWTLPDSDGTSGQVLSTNGSGVLSWTAIGAPAADSLDFTHFSDAMTLDASTDISVTGSNVLSVTNSGTGNSLVVNDQAADTTPFIINAAGRVGIGTVTPQREVHVANSDDAWLQLGTRGDSAADEAGIMLVTKDGHTNTLGNAITRGWEIYGSGHASTAPNALNFTYWDGSSWNDFMRMDTSGNLGIGTLTPSERLDIEGTIRSGPKGVAAGEGGAIKFNELAANGTNTVGFSAPDSIAANVLWQLPSADGSSGQVLQTNGSGVLTWATPGAPAADSLDFTHFADAMTLDASTDFGVTGTNVLSVTNTGTGNSFVVNDQAGDTTPFLVNSDGRVGIGTNNPSEKLVVTGGGGTRFLVSDTSGSYAAFKLQGSSTVAADFARFSGGDAQNNYWGMGMNGASSTFSIWEAPGGPTPRFSILPGGNIGIGTITPIERLDVEGSLLSGPKGTAAGEGGAIKFEELAANGVNSVGFRAPDSIAANVLWQLPDADGTSGQVLQTNGSGVLSWVTASGAPAADSLDFTHFADAMTLDASTDISVTGTNALSITNSGTGNSFRVNDAAGDTSPFVIDANGWVGIGTTTPLRPLHISQGFAPATAKFLTDWSGQTFTDGGEIGMNSSNEFNLWNYENSSIVFHTNGSERARILGNGNMGIGTNLPGEKLDVEGSLLSGPKGTAAGEGGAIKFEELAANGVNSVGFRAPDSIAANVLWQLPDADGTSGQVLQTNGSGVLSWVTASGAPAADSLDFTHFADAMTLDASTDISVTGTNALSITNSGTGNSFRVNDAAGDTSPFVIDANGNVGVGSATPGDEFVMSYAKNDDVIMRVVNTDAGGNAEADFIADIGGSRFTAYGHGGAGHTWNSNIYRNRGFIYTAPNSDGMVVVNHGADPIIMATNAVERMRIDGSGNVGIGTTTPTNLLELSGGDLGIQSFSSSANIKFKHAMGTKSSPSATTSGQSMVAISATGYGTTGYSSGTSAKIVMKSESTFDDTHGAASIAFHTRSSGATGPSSSRMIIDSDGNVGIGTTAPIEKLTVVTNSAANDGVLILQNTNSAAYSETSFLDSSGNWRTTFGYGNSTVTATHFQNRAFQWLNTGVDFVMGNTSGGLLTVQNAGNVGIGTTAPGTRLDVSGAVTSRPSGTGAGQTGQIALRELAATGTNTFTLRAPDALSADRFWVLPDSNGTSGQVLQTDGSGVLSWVTSGGVPAADSLDFTHFADAMTLDASTDVAVTGTNVLSITNTGTGNSFRVNDAAGDTTPFVINASGNVGIGTSSPWGKLTLWDTDADTELTIMNDDATSAKYPGVRVLNFMGTPNSGHPHINLVNSRGSDASPAAVVSGDVLGSIDFTGMYNSSWNQSVGALFQGEADENWSATNRGARLTFDTTLNGTTSPVERMRINNAGFVGIGTTAPNTTLDINGAVSNRGIASPAVSPAGQGRIYFDSTANKYRVSENGGTYQDLVIGSNACPAGFTKVGNMGCIQNDEEGTGTWFAANDDCFSTYNGRLPTYAEWYLAMNNNALSNETDDPEWMGDITSNADALRAGSTGITVRGEIGTANPNAYRCWIPLPR